MSFHAFIQQANQFGEQRQPFFFLIDFEQQQPIICPLAQAAELGLFLRYEGSRMSIGRLKCLTSLLNCTNFLSQKQLISVALT